MKKFKAKASTREIVIGRSCDYRGIVTESSKMFGINYCGNSDCKGCNAYAKQFHKYVLEFVKDFKPESLLAEDFILPETSIEKLTITYEHKKDSESA